MTSWSCCAADFITSVTRLPRRRWAVRGDGPGIAGVLWSFDRYMFQRVSMIYVFFFSSRRRHTRLQGDWSSDVCSSDLNAWRRVVPSPLPRDIVELPLLRELVKAGQIVIAAGGGGIPVMRDSHGNFREIGRASCRERV